MYCFGALLSPDSSGNTELLSWFADPGSFHSRCFPGMLDTAHMFMRGQKSPHANQKLCVAAKPHLELMEDRLAIMPSH